VLDETPLQSQDYYQPEQQKLDQVSMTKEVILRYFMFSHGIFSDRIELIGTPNSYS